MRKKQDATPCDECGSRCCKYVATQIDTPTCKRDYDYIRWYLVHKDVHVFKDHHGHWYLEFETHCAKLEADGRCRDYDNRPHICRAHGEHEECEFVSDKPSHILRFSKAKHFEAYLDSRGIDWRWKRRPHPHG